MKTTLKLNWLWIVMFGIIIHFAVSIEESSIISWNCSG